MNAALFGCTAKQWREANPEAHLEGKNIRDIASINELTVLANLESLNAIMIKQGLEKKARLMHLIDSANDQLRSLDKIDFIKSLKRTSQNIYIKALKENKKSK